jgi:hypothetical protein
MLFGSLWYKNIRVLHLILDNGPTHAPKQIKKWIRSLDLPFRVKIHCLPIHASRLDQVEIVLSYVQRRRRGKMIVGKTPFKSGRRKQPRIIAQFPVESRFRAGGGRFQIVQGIPSNLHEEGFSCRLCEPIPATASYPYLSVVTDQKQCAVSGRIIWINSLGNECGVKVENATTNWKQFILATLNDARTSLSSDCRTLNRR